MGGHVLCLAAMLSLVKELHASPVEVRMPVFISNSGDLIGSLNILTSPSWLLVLATLGGCDGCDTVCAFCS